MEARDTVYIETICMRMADGRVLTMQSTPMSFQVESSDEVVKVTASCECLVGTTPHAREGE